MESLVSPAAKIAPGYGSIAVTKKDGEIIAGRLVREDDAVVVLADNVTNEKTTIQREMVKEMSTPVSLMPPMGLLLSKRQLRDVIAYLASLKEG